MHITAYNNPQVPCPNCLNLSFENSKGCYRLIFTAPELLSISFDFCTFLSQTIDKDLSESLSNSPRLKGLHSYKLWGIDELRPLYLPSVEGVSFYRADSLRALKLYAPRLEELNLRAAYAISSVTLLEHGKNEHEHLLHIESGRPINLPKKNIPNSH